MDKDVRTVAAKVFGSYRWQRAALALATVLSMIGASGAAFQWW